MYSKMKKTTLIFLLSISQFLTCQVSGYVEYFYSKNLGVDYETLAVLNFDSTKSHFIELSPDAIPKVDLESTEEIVVTSFSKKRPAVWIDLKKDTLFEQLTLFNKIYTTKEKVPSIAWQILNEFKTINKFKCQLAIGKFRGRTYKAWFTLEIPTSFGPWKLQGLPGLILEAVDDKKELIFNVKKITLGLNKKIESVANEKAIELKNFINFKKDIYKEKEKSMSSKMPRNSSFELNLPDRITQKEIIYEWEEAKDKKD